LAIGSWGGCENTPELTEADCPGSGSVSGGLTRLPVLQIRIRQSLGSETSRQQGSPSIGVAGIEPATSGLKDRIETVDCTDVVSGGSIW
jgi:hypothetical protein